MRYHKLEVWEIQSIIYKLRRNNNVSYLPLVKDLWGSGMEKSVIANAILQETHCMSSV